MDLPRVGNWFESSFSALQGSLQNLLEYSPVLHDLSLEPRGQSAVETTAQLSAMFQTKPVDAWTDHILAIDAPDYYLTFAGTGIQEEKEKTILCLAN